MGKRGPQAKPVAMKLADGTYRPDRDGALPVRAATPEPPEWLADDAREIWSEVIPQLAEIEGLLARVDRYALARYCMDWIEYREACEMIERDGMVSVGENGGEYQHPAVGIKNQAAIRLARCEAKFGMTASDRVGMRLQPKRREGVRRRQA